MESNHINDDGAIKVGKILVKGMPLLYLSNVADFFLVVITLVTLADAIMKINQ